jgi:flagellar protein FliO/FliZ
MIAVLLAIGASEDRREKQAEGRMTESLFGTEMPLAMQFCLAFLTVLGLIGATAWAVSRFGIGRLEGSGSRGRQSRLSVVDFASVDRVRRLILIRRDNVEHLLMIGGPTDMVIEPNIMGAVAVPREVAVTHWSAAALPPPPRVNPLPDTGSRPRQPELAAIPRQARQIAPIPEALAALPFPSQAKTPMRLQPDTLAALADNLSNRPPPPGKSPIIVMRPHPIELHPELRLEPRVEPKPEPGISAGRATTVETASTPDEELADLARQLEAALRKPSATAARPSATAARAAPAHEQAPAAGAVPIHSSPMRALRSPTDARLSTTPSRATLGPAPGQIAAVTAPPSPLRVPRPSEPKPPRADANPNQSKTPHGSIKQH